MKKLFILLCLFWSLSAVGMVTQNSYLSASGGYLYIAEKLKGAIPSQEVYKFGLEYGTSIILKNNYIGLLGAGVSQYSGAVTALHLKYGYEFMRAERVSLGVDVSALIGVQGIMDDNQDFLIGGAMGVSGKISITQSVAAVVRFMGELIHTTDDGRTLHKGFPALDVSIRWYL